VAAIWCPAETMAPLECGPLAKLEATDNPSSLVQLMPVVDLACLPMDGGWAFEYWTKLEDCPDLFLWQLDQIVRN
jgi:hypothetical protein